MNEKNIWLVIGFTGQLMFTMRFVVQWLQSERMRKSIVPTAFWYFSIAGGVVLLSYAIHKKDPVFITGQAAGVFIYLRNIYFITRERKNVPASAHPPVPAELGR